MRKTPHQHRTKIHYQVKYCVLTQMEIQLLEIHTEIEHIRLDIVIRKELFGIKMGVYGKLSTVHLEPKQEMMNLIELISVKITAGRKFEAKKVEKEWLLPI